MKRIAYLEGIRGVAATFVVIGHCVEMAQRISSGAGWLLGGVLRLVRIFGLIPVPVFIVLSGYCLALPCIDQLSVKGGILEYMRRRCLRILPAYWFALAFSVLVGLAVTGAVTLSQIRHGDPNLVGPLFLITDVYGAPVCDASLWSMAVEFHAYLMLPVFFLAWSRWGLFRSLMGSTCAILMIEAFYPKSRIYMDALFLAGAATAWIVTQPAAARLNLWAIYASAAVCVCIMWYGYNGDELDYISMDMAAGVLAALFLAVFASGRATTAATFLSGPVPTWLGKRSYSLYLLHVPVLSIATLLYKAHTNDFTTSLALLCMVFPFSVLLAIGSYQLFELPRWSRINEPVAASPFTVDVVPK